MSDRPAARLADAVRLHQSGQLDEAERRYRRHLREHREDAEALYLLGALRLQKGDAGEGLAYLRRAVALMPSAPHFLETLASASEMLGGFEAALAHARHALAVRIAPGPLLQQARLLFQLQRYGDAHATFETAARLGVGGPAVRLDAALCLRRLGRWTEAEALYRTLLAAADVAVDALVGLAETAEEAGRPADAAQPLRRAVAVAPTHVPARLKQAEVLLKLDGAEAAAGIATSVLAILPRDPGADSPRVAALSVLAAALRAQRRIGEAMAPMRRLLALEAAQADAWSNLADLAAKSTDAPRAIALAGRALAIDPSHVGALVNRGLALDGRERSEEALRHLRRAVALQPADKTTLSNFHGPLASLRQWDLLEAFLGRALAIDPDFAMAWYMRGSTALMRGDLRKGWPLFLWRFRSPGIQVPRPFALPWWDGRPLSGRLLVWGEQGVGDEVAHAGMLHDLVARGVAAVVECDPRLVSILARSFPSLEVVARSDPPDARLTAADVVAQTAMGDLARHYRLEISDFPRGRGFLAPDADRLAASRSWLSGLGPGLKVGIAWRSSRRDADALRFHTSLLAWRPILETSGCFFVNLQYGDCREEIAEVERRFGARIRSMPGLDLRNDLEGLLALCAALDVAISTPSASSTLAGAAGTLVLQLLTSDNYLSLGGDRFPWLPRAEGAVRRHGESWDTAIGMVARRIAHLAEPDTGKAPEPS